MKNLIPLIALLILASVIFMYNFLDLDQDKNTPPEKSIVELVNENPGVIIDVRTQGEYDAGHLVDADFQFDFRSGEFESKLDSLDKSKTYYLYCRSGNRSGQSAKIMKDRGFENVHNIGGYQDLVDAGFESSDSGQE